MCLLGGGRQGQAGVGWAGCVGWNVKDGLSTRGTLPSPSLAHVTPCMPLTNQPTLSSHYMLCILQRRVNELLGSSSGGGSGSAAMRAGAGSGTGLGPLGLLQAGGSRAGSGAHTPSRSPRSPRAGSGAASAAGQQEPDAVSPKQHQEQQQQENSGYLPSTEQIYGRLSSDSSDGREATPAGAPDSTAHGSTAQGGTAPGSTAPVMAAAEKEYLAHQIAALRISLAKRDADVARLEGRCNTHVSAVSRCLLFWGSG